MTVQDLAPWQRPTVRWAPVCSLGDLPPEQGLAALLPGGVTVALFRLHSGEIHAVGNVDPFTGAPVICHGIVGDRGGTPVVTGPLGKETFALATGRCLEPPESGTEVRLPVYGVRVTGEVVEVSCGVTGVTGVTPRGNAGETRVG